MADNGIVLYIPKASQKYIQENFKIIHLNDGVRFYRKNVILSY
jgi:hypothetical protein